MKDTDVCDLVSRPHQASGVTLDKSTHLSSPKLLLRKREDIKTNEPQRLLHSKFSEPQELVPRTPRLHSTWLLSRGTLTFVVWDLIILRAPDGTHEVPVVLSIWPDSSSAHLRKE